MADGLLGSVFPQRELRTAALPSSNLRRSRVNVRRMDLTPRLLALSVASLGCASASPGTTSSQDGGPGGASPEMPDARLSEDVESSDAAPPPIVVDCRPRLDGGARFGGQCQYVESCPGDCLPILMCPGEVPGDVASLVIRVRQASSITVGAPIPLAGSSPVVTVDFDAVIGDLLVETSADAYRADGHIVFDEYVPGQIIRGHFQEALVQALPEPPFDCRLSNSTFVAERSAQ